MLRNKTLTLLWLRTCGSSEVISTATHEGGYTIHTCASILTGVTGTLIDIHIASASSPALLAETHKTLSLWLQHQTYKDTETKHNSTYT